MVGSKTASGSAADRPPFIAFALDAKDQETLRAFALSQQWSPTDIHQGDITTATEYLKSHPSPTLLLVELPSAAEAPGMLDKLADVVDPATKVITTGSINEYSFYCWLMDIGIFSYMLKPLVTPTLEAAYQKAVAPPAAQAKQGKQPGKVISLVGTRGGVGASTLALNLSGMIADITKKNVALVDVDPQAGSIALALDIEPSRGIREAMEKPERIDSLFIDRVMSKPLKNLAILSAEEALHEHVNVHEQTAMTLLKELRDKFDIVLLDIPRNLSNYTRQCLRLSDQVVLVTEMTLLSLRDAMRIGDMMRESLKVKPPMIVANRVGFMPKQELQPGDFEKGVGGKIAARIPFAPDLFMQVGIDIPALKMKSHAAVKPLQALAEQLVPDAKQKAGAAAPAAKTFSLFKKAKE